MKAQIKKLTLRLPEECWKPLKKASYTLDISLNTLVVAIIKGFLSENLKPKGKKGEK